MNTNMNENTSVITCESCGCVIENEADIVTLPDGTQVCSDCARMIESGEVVRCDDCGNFVRKDDTIEFDGMTLCEDCRDSRDLVQCRDCGEWFDPSDVTEIETGWRRENYFLCENCYDAAINNDDVFHCDECGDDLDASSYDYYNTIYDTTICESCYCNRDYVTCNDCGAVLHMDDANWDDEDEEYYCNDCYRPRHRNRKIHDYGFKPYPVFHGTPTSAPKYGDPITIGFELEVDCGDDRYDCAEAITDAFDEDTLYLKNDGSVDFEIVTHPRTLESYMKDIDFDKLCTIPRDFGYQSHTAGTCGLHCHVGRAQLGSTVSAQRKVITRIALLMYRHWDSLVKFSRRKASQLSHWASAPEFRFGYGMSYDEDTLVSLVKDYYSHRGRYQALNLEPSQTIEFRLWRGTLVPDTLKATLQMTSNIVMFCMNNTIDTVINSKWSDIVGYAHYKELDEYIASKELMDGEVAKTIPFGERKITREAPDQEFKKGDMVKVVNTDGELVSSGVVGATGHVTEFYDDDDIEGVRILILLDGDDTFTRSAAVAFGHWAGGLATNNNGYWVYPQNIELYPVAG